MASQTQGIQQLLAAEKKAADKVAEARKSKCFFITYFDLPSFSIHFELLVYFSCSFINVLINLHRESTQVEAGQGRGSI